MRFSFRFSRSLATASGHQDLQSPEIRLRHASLEAQDFEGDDLVLGVEVENDAGLYLVGLHDLGAIQSKVQRVNFPVIANLHGHLHCRPRDLKPRV